MVLLGNEEKRAAEAGAYLSKGARCTSSLGLPKKDHDCRNYSSTYKERMTYYYDSEAGVMISVDPQTKDVRILEPVNFEKNARPSPQIAADATKSRFTGKGCPECGSPSRHKKDCSASVKAPATKRKLGVACEECGSLSRRHKLGCSFAGGNKAWASLEREEKKRSGLMSQREYSQVKTAHTHGMDPTSISKEMNLTVKEVNTAVLSKNFEEYTN
jgi:hypothetical protein